MSMPSTIVVVAGGSAAADFGGGPIPWGGCGYGRGFLAGYDAITGAYKWSEGTCPVIADSFSEGATQQDGGTVVALGYGRLRLIDPSGTEQQIGDGANSMLLLRVRSTDGRASVIAATGGNRQGITPDNTAVDNNGRIYLAGRAPQFSTVFGHDFQSTSDFIAG